MSDRLTRVLRALLPRKMADAVDAHSQGTNFEPGFIAQQISAWVTGDRIDRANIMAFIEGDGPGMIEQAIVEMQATEAANIPTAEELKRLLTDDYT